MKGLILVAMAILVPLHTVAQRGGARGVGRGTGGSGSIARPIRPMLPTAPNSNGPGQNLNSRGVILSGRSNRSVGPGGYGWGGYPYCGDCGYQNDYGEGGYQSPPNGMVAMPFQDGPAYPPPPRPVRSEIREYHWPDPPGNPNATFSIVSKDGTIYRAALVWAQDNSVRFLTPEGTSLELPLASVDRERTSQANAEQNLKIQLPPGN